MSFFQYDDNTILILQFREILINLQFLHNDLLNENIAFNVFSKLMSPLILIN